MTDEVKNLDMTEGKQEIQTYAVSSSNKMATWGDLSDYFSEDSSYLSNRCVTKGSLLGRSLDIPPLQANTSKKISILDGDSRSSNQLVPLNKIDISDITVRYLCLTSIYNLHYGGDLSYKTYFISDELPIVGGTISFNTPYYSGYDGSYGTYYNALCFTGFGIYSNVSGGTYTVDGTSISGGNSFFQIDRNNSSFSINLPLGNFTSSGMEYLGASLGSHTLSITPTASGTGLIPPANRFTINYNVVNTINSPYTDNGGNNTITVNSNGNAVSSEGLFPSTLVFRLSGERTTYEYSPMPFNSWSNGRYNISINRVDGPCFYNKFEISHWYIGNGDTTPRRVTCSPTNNLLQSNNITVTLYSDKI